jgi:DNA-binding NtrC family response regulator
MAERIRRMSEDGGMLSAMQERCRSFAVRNLAWEENVREVTNVFERVVGC